MHISYSSIDQKMAKKTHNRYQKRLIICTNGTQISMELSDWVNKITFSEILFLPAIFDWNNPKKHVYCSFPTGFSGNLFFS